MEDQEKKIRDTLEKHFDLLSECAECWIPQAKSSNEGVDVLVAINNQMVRIAALLLMPIDNYNKQY